MSAPSEGITRGPEYRLFDAGAVGLAAFICCPLAGAILMAVNYVRMGKTGKGIFAVTLGLLATALNILIKLNWKTPSGSLSRLEYDAFEIIFLICTWMFTWQIAKEEQGKAVKEHIARGGELGSRETAFFVGLATVVALVVVGGGAVYGFQYRKIVVIGNRNQVIYSKRPSHRIRCHSTRQRAQEQQLFLGPRIVCLYSIRESAAQPSHSPVQRRHIWNQEGDPVLIRRACARSISDSGWASDPRSN